MATLNPTKLIIALACICGFVSACNVSGQVGDSFNFRTSKKNMEIALDSLYAQHPEYQVPAKWQGYNNFSPGVSAYVEGKTFYFNSGPEEMYYVSLIDGSKISHRHSPRTSLAIRAINTGAQKWLLESDMDYSGEDRVHDRFEKEIVSKLEAYTKTKASRGE